MNKLFYFYKTKSTFMRKTKLILLFGLILIALSCGTETDPSPQDQQSNNDTILDSSFVDTSIIDSNTTNEQSIIEIPDSLKHLDLAIFVGDSLTGIDTCLYVVYDWNITIFADRIITIEELDLYQFIYLELPVNLEIKTYSVEPLSRADYEFKFYQQETFYDHLSCTNKPWDLLDGYQSLIQITKYDKRNELISGNFKIKMCYERGDENAEKEIIVWGWFRDCKRVSFLL